jgi:hypothetical protein
MTLSHEQHEFKSCLIRRLQGDSVVKLGGMPDITKPVIFNVRQTGEVKRISILVSYFCYKHYYVSDVL